MRSSSNSRPRLLSRSASMRSRTAGSMFPDAAMMVSHRSLMMGPSAPQDAAEGAAHDRATDRAAHLAAERLAEIGGDLADHAVGDRARDLARDRLAGRETLPALAGGAEDRSQNAAEAARLLLGFGLGGTAAPCRWFIRHGLVHALLQHLECGLGVDRGVVLALQRAFRHHALA